VAFSHAVREFDEMGFDLDVGHQNEFAQAPVLVWDFGTTDLPRSSRMCWQSGD